MYPRSLTDDAGVRTQVYIHCRSRGRWPRRRTRWYLGPVFHESGMRKATVCDLYVCRIQHAIVWGMKKAVGRVL